MSDEVNKKIHQWLGKCLHRNAQRNAINPLDIDCLDCGQTLSPRQYHAEREGCRHSEQEPKFGKSRVCKFCGADDVSFDLGIPNLPIYDSDPAAMLELIETLRQKGYEICITDEKSDSVPAYFARIYDDNIGEAATLPMAVALATIELIKAAEQK